MFTIKIKGKQNPKSPKMVKIELIFFRTGYNRVPKVLNITGTWKDWNQTLQCFNPKTSENIELNRKLNDEVLKYQKVAERWEEENSNWTPIELSHFFDIRESEIESIYSDNVFSTIQLIEQNFRSKKRLKNGKIVTSNNNADNYVWLLDSLVEFTKKKYNQPFKAYLFKQITPQFLLDYVDFTIKKSTKYGNNGGIRHKLKYLRATINFARKNNIKCPPNEIFNVVSIHMQEPVPKSKAVSYDTIVKIENMNRSHYNKNQNLYIDLFLFSFYTGGMSNVDVCHLTYDEIQDGSIDYERRKCAKNAAPILIDKAKILMGKYKHMCYGDYVMPVFDSRHLTEEAQHKRVENFTVYVNKMLKRVCKELRISEHITWYSARGAFITKMIDEGYNPVLVASMAGNSPNMIYKHYYKNTKESNLIKEMNSLL